MAILKLLVLLMCSRAAVGTESSDEENAMFVEAAIEAENAGLQQHISFNEWPVFLPFLGPRQGSFFGASPLICFSLFEFIQGSNILEMVSGKALPQLAFSSISLIWFRSWI